MIQIMSYDVINGGKTSTILCKPHLLKSIEEVDQLQKRAEKIWKVRCKHKITVYIHFTNLNRHNPKSPNLGKHDFRLLKWV